jgi:hypothetical protein
MKKQLVAHFGIASPHVNVIAFVTLILSGFSTQPCGATVYHSDGSLASVQALQNQAGDGDTITLPAGIFSWTSRLDIRKGLTLQGETTIDGAGTSNPRITDATIIKDDTPRRGPGAGILRVEIDASQSFRLTGITFAPGNTTTTSSTDGAFHLLSQGSGPCTSMRVDHCHFDSLYQGKLIWVSGWVYGVADHNVIECRGRSFPFYITHANWGGPSQNNGNGSWADYPWYGTEKFFFMETNTIIRNNAAQAFSLVDTVKGGRWVARHNYIKNCIPSGHGTESGAQRGQRVNEFYNNTVNMTVPWNGGGQRSGTSLWHDNTFIGVESTHGSHCNLANVRETSARAYPVWGIADGTSVWDQNDTEGNGTYVEGRPPYLFDSGAATSGTTITGTQGTFTDSTKNWTPNRWAGYSIKNTDPGSPSYTLGSYIISNTATTITYFYYNGTDTRAHLIFNAGDTYQIHRVLTMMDQNGRGKGDQVTGTPQPINTTTGTPWWTHQALEPCYSWNNVHSPSNHVYGFRTAVGQPTTKLGIDYFNLGGGFPSNTTPLAVSSRYTAAVNGVNYTATFVYPHPLVTAQPTPTPSDPACSLLQKRLNRLQRRIERLERRHRPHRKLNRRLHRVQRQLQLQHCL